MKIHECLFGGEILVIVTDLNAMDDEAYPQAIGPFESREKAREWIESFANRKRPYLGLQFDIAVQFSPQSFNNFCSWEE